MTEIQKKDAKILDLVKDQINMLKEAGEIQFPKNYSPDNALRSAWMELHDLKNKDGKSVLESCTRVSIARALSKMVFQGMNPVKNQCYFIAYGDSLNFQRSYQGTIALAKRVAGVVDVNANVIYDGDKYTTEIDKKGARQLVSHESPFENRDDNKIKGAYAVIVFSDGSTKIEEMTILEIKKSWMQGATNGNTPAHKNFPAEMCKKSVIKRALKTVVNSSSDSDLFEEDETKPEKVAPEPKATKEVSFDDFEEVKEEKKEPDPKQESKEKVKKEPF